MSKYEACPYFWGLTQEGKRYFVQCGESHIGFETQEFAKKKINECCKGEGMTGCRPFIVRQLKEMGVELESSWSLGELKAEYNKRSSEMCTDCTNNDEDCRPGSEDNCIAYQREEVPVRPLETIEAEINFYKTQTATGIIEIGKRLIEAKEQLQHGEWGKWLEEKVEFTERTAQNFMRVAREVAKTKSLSDLPITKVYALLDVPAEERESFIEEPHQVNGEEKTVDEMTTRELQEAIRARREAEERARSAELALKQSRDAHKSKDDLHKDKLNFLNKQISDLQNQLSNPQVVEKVIEKVPADVQHRLEQLNAQLDRYKAEAETAKQDTKKLEEIRSTIKHLESHRDKLNEYMYQSENLATFRAGALDMLKHLSLIRYAGLLEAAKDNTDLMATVREVVDMVRKWVDDMTEELDGSTYINARVVDVNE